jgi:hypothetical protein
MAVRSIWHWGPLVALTIIVTLFISTIYFILEIPQKGALFQGYLFVWAFMVCGILYSFFKAIYTGAGAVPQNWVPYSFILYSQFSVQATQVMKRACSTVRFAKDLKRLGLITAINGELCCPQLLPLTVGNA